MLSLNSWPAERSQKGHPMQWLEFALIGFALAVATIVLASHFASGL